MGPPENCWETKPRHNVSYLAVILESIQSNFWWLFESGLDCYREGLYINPCLIMLSAILMMASSFDRGSHPKTVLMHSVEIS